MTTTHPDSDIASRDLPRALTFGVNQHRLLGEVGLFFSSATAAFAECVQNAYRADATTLRVIADPTRRTVVLRDNGIGLDDPSKLLTVAESGWDVERVKHAAGLGSLALFAIATDVEILSVPCDGSPPWRLHFTDAALRGEAPVECWDAISTALWAEHGDEPHGIEIRATLRESATFPKLDAEGSAAWRHRFPLAITIESPDPKATGNVVQATYTVQPHGGYRIETAVGTLCLVSDLRAPLHAHRYGIGARHAVVEWEHRLTGTISLADDLITAETCPTLSRAVRDELVERLRCAATIVWVVAPDATVEAKLPDRETLIRDEGFRAAMQVLANAIVAEFNVAEIRDAFVALAQNRPIVTLPEIADAARKSTTPFRPRFGVLALASFTPQPFLGMAGYYLATGGNDLSSVECYFVREADGSEFITEFETSSAMTMPVYTSGFAAIAVESGVAAIAPYTSSDPAGLIPLHIAFGEMLHVESLQAVFVRDLHFAEPTGTRVAALTLPVFEDAHDALADCDEDLAARLPRDGAPTFAIFGLPSASDQGAASASLADAVMQYVRDSVEFSNYVTIMAGEHRGGDFALDIGDYETPYDDRWDVVRLMADAHRLVADAAGGEHVIAAERVAILAELDDMLTVPLVMYDRAEKLNARAAAIAFDPALMAQILSARATLQAARSAVRLMQRQTPDATRSEPHP